MIYSLPVGSSIFVANKEKWYAYKRLNLDTYALTSGPYPKTRMPEPKPLISYDECGPFTERDFKAVEAYFLKPKS